MTEQQEKATSPYLPPTSNLRDDREDLREWSEFTSRCAERYCRSLVFGRVFAMSSYVFVKVLFDTGLHGWEQSVLNKPMTQGLLISCLVLVTLTVPGVKIFVYFQRLTNTVNTFLEDGREELKRLLSRPIGIAVFMLSVCLLLFLTEGFSGGWPNTARFWHTVGISTLLSLPLVVPIAYIVARTARKRAEDWLEQMSSET